MQENRLSSCPETESNRRHEDFQAGSEQEESPEKIANGDAGCSKDVGPSTPEPIALAYSTDVEECPGAGMCHGCLKWCDACGDVAHVCDARTEGHRCDCHPMPPEWLELRAQRRAAEQMVWEGKELVRKGAQALEEVEELEAARRAHDRQCAALWEKLTRTPEDAARREAVKR